MAIFIYIFMVKRNISNICPNYRFILMSGNIIYKGNCHVFRVM